MIGRLRCFTVILGLLAVPTLLVFAASGAENAGHIKVAKGTVQIERSGQRLAASVGDAVQPGDAGVSRPSASAHSRGTVGGTLPPLLSGWEDADADRRRSAVSRAARRTSP